MNNQQDLISPEIKNSNLSFGDNLDSHLLPLHVSLLGLGGASIPEMPLPNLFTKLVFGEELLGETKTLIQSQLNLAPFRD